MWQSVAFIPAFTPEIKKRNPPVSIPVIPGAKAISAYEIA